MESMASSVNGPGGMYQLKSFYDDSTQMDLPTCMYSMKSLHSSNTAQPKESQDDQNLAELENRQENILAKLNELKAKVDALAKEQCPSVSSPPSQSVASSRTCSQKTPLDGLTTIHDLVISANPCNPPLSIAVLHQLLADQYKVVSNCHTHSSIKNRLEEKLKFALGSNGLVQRRTGAQLAFTLIWKDVKHGPTLMVSPNVQTAIMGEGPIARYLARLLNPTYDSEDIATATEIDQLVDLAGPLVHGNSKEKAGILRTLNSRLGKAQYLTGEFSLADIVLWSAVNQAKQAESAPANVKKWLERCDNHSAFRLARKMI